MINIKDIFRFFYSKLPDSISHSWKYHRIYSETSRLLYESEHWNNARVLDYQNKRIQEIVFYAYTYVPYYKRIMDELGITPDQIKTVKDLEKLPCLTKEIILQEGNNMLSSEFSSKDIETHLTGGSTGVPATFAFEKNNDQAREDASVGFVYAKFGYKKGNKTAIFGDVSFLREAQRVNSKLICKKYPGSKNWFFVESQIETDSESYLKKLQEISVQWIIACPSYLYRLATALAEKGIKRYEGKLCGIIFKSEMLYPFQEQVIRRFFNTNMYNVYGHTEHLCMAYSFIDEGCYHFVDSYGLAQFEHVEDGKDELIATGFYNKAMPLIKYRTRDLFTLSDDFEKTRTIESIEGRRSDFLYLKNGRVVSDVFCDFTVLAHSWQEDIQQYQIIQSEIGRCVLRMVPRTGCCIEDLKKEEIKKKCEEYFFNNMDIEIEIVDAIPRTCRGKEKLIVSSIYNPKSSRNL